MDFDNIDFNKLKNIGIIMSNFDHQIDYELASKLGKGTYGLYTALNFLCFIILDGTDCVGILYKNNELIDTIRAYNLQGLMRIASERYGWE